MGLTSSPSLSLQKFYPSSKVSNIVTFSSSLPAAYRDVLLRIPGASPSRTYVLCVGENVRGRTGRARSSRPRQGCRPRIAGGSLLLARGNFPPPAGCPAHGRGARLGPFADRTRRAVRDRPHRLRAANYGAVHVRRDVPLRAYPARPPHVTGGGALPQAHAALTVRGALRADARRGLRDPLRHDAPE